MSPSPPGPRNLVVCCDGTGNEVAGDASNILKLFRILVKDESQLVYYDPGVGTIGFEGEWAELRTRASAIWGLATGAGLDRNILEAYRFLVRNYRKGDRIFLFGFSRGAYTVRALAGFLHMIGLLPPDQENISDYALTIYKKAGWAREKHRKRANRASSTALAEADAKPAWPKEFVAAWDFAEAAGAFYVPIHFMGVWDTVASMIVRRPGWLGLPTLRTLPYTRKNKSVRAFRQAIAIDERRRMYRLNWWLPNQPFAASRFATATVPQDCAEQWFTGVHADIGGGYPERESGLAKCPLIWMVEEATRTEHDLRIVEGRYNLLAKGGKAGRHVYEAPDCAASPHRSLKAAWWLLELLPKDTRWRETAWFRVPFWYLPLGERRRRSPPPETLTQENAIHRLLRYLALTIYLAAYGLSGIVLYSLLRHAQLWLLGGQLRGTLAAIAWLRPHLLALLGG